MRVSFSAMRRLPTSFILLLCISLLAMQTSGLHLHVNLDSLSTALHGPHFHDVDTDGHDHEADIDVSPFEPAPAGAKLIPFLVGFLITLLFAVYAKPTFWRLVRKRLPQSRYHHWRPPLRAPPHHA